MLTTTQNQLLKAAIAADGTMSAQPNTTAGNTVIKGLLEQDAAPAFVVWKSVLTLDEITQNGFTWTEVDNLAVGKARIWEWMFKNSTNSINPSKSNVQAGIVECWSGTAGRLAVQAVVLSHCKRNATRLEKILATGTGTTLSPAVMGYEGPISTDDIETARNS